MMRNDDNTPANGEFLVVADLESGDYSAAIVDDHGKRHLLGGGNIRHDDHNAKARQTGNAQNGRGNPELKHGQ